MAGDQNEDGLINFDLFVKTVTDEAMYWYLLKSKK